jgi:hypothetical protein
MNDTPFEPFNSAARPSKQSNGTRADLPPFKPPRTLLEAIDAAREAAQAEVLYHLPDDAPTATIEAVLEAGSAFTNAESVAVMELVAFLPMEKQEALSGEIAEWAINKRLTELAGRFCGQPEIAAAPGANPVAEAALGEEEEEQPDEQFAALLAAITDAFASACEHYGYMPMPVGVPFEAFSDKTHDRFIRWGRRDAFNTLKSVLTWDAAAAMAELIAEAAWQFRARELATPASAFKVASKPKFKIVGN